MIDEDRILEEEILRAYEALDISERNPSGFLRLVRRLYPDVTTGIATKARGWQSCRTLVYALRLPSVVEEHGGNLEHRVEMSVCLESSIDIISAAQRVSKITVADGESISFCRYCWRLGEMIRDRRGYNDLNRGRRHENHAYCGVHRPRSQKLTTVGRGHEKMIFRKVLNQKEIQKARKVSRLASRIESCVIARDRRLSRDCETGRSWVLGDYLIVHKLDNQWKQLVTSFFPYVASSSTWSAAASSPNIAFELLESDNWYQGKDVLHQNALSNPELMAKYLMPMMLRLDTSLEVELMISNRKRKYKKEGFDRYPLQTRDNVGKNYRGLS